ncbi:MAG: D-alanyl-D-alanine carboxypeptidase family protein [Evtepia sp.]
MNLRALLALPLAFLLAIPTLALESPKNSATSAILMDADSGRVLYEKNPNEKRLIASITKLMTALIAVETEDDLMIPVKIKKEWTQIEGSSLYLRAGETLSLKTLLYGLLLQSGNDAAVAIAGFCAGDVDTFVSEMNERAQQIGMEHTHFANPNGLNDPDHYSTAADMAKLARVCIQNSNIASVVATKSISLEGRSFVNHNKLLWQYKDCIGMKTGFTQMAGRTLVSAAKRGDQTLIVVTLDDANDWNDHKTLFDYGFETYPQHLFCRAGKQLRRIPVEGSLIRSVPILLYEDIAYPMAESDKPTISLLLPATVSAPIKEGTIAGQITCTLNGTIVADSYLIYGASAERSVISGTYGIQKMLKLFRMREMTFTAAFQAIMMPS